MLAMHWPIRAASLWLNTATFHSQFSFAPSSRSRGVWSALMVVSVAAGMPGMMCLEGGSFYNENCRTGSVTAS
jgi:hypothetical protein